MNDEAVLVERPKVESTHFYHPEKELKLYIHTDENVFLTLESEWTELARLSDQMICMSSEWASTWWKYIGRNQNRSLFILTVYDNEKLIAILPFYKGYTKVGSIIVQRRLQLIGSGGSLNEQLGFTDDYGISDFLDVIVDPDYKHSVAILFVNLLRSSDLSDYKITFHQIRDDSYVRTVLFPLIITLNRKVQAELSDACHFVRIDQNGDFQDFINKSKTNARRRFRQTLRAQGIENEYFIEEPASITDVVVMIDKLMHLHQDRWNKIGYPGAFQDDRFREFFTEISFIAYHHDQLWLKQAVDKNGVCAVRMLLKFNGRYYDYMSGYDVDSTSAKHRPGIGLLLDLVENSFAQHIETIELLRGDEEYKHDFTQLAMNNWKIIIHVQKHWKTGWGFLDSIVQFCSTVFKYVTREKMLMRVQYKKVGFIKMLPAYFKFRLALVQHKINERK